MNKKGLTQTSLLIGLAFIFVFIVAIVSFGIKFASDNNAVISISSDANVSNLNSQFTGDYQNFLNDSNSSSQILKAGTVPSGATTTSSGGGFSMTAGFNTVNHALGVVKQSLFGGDNNSFNIVIGVFVAVLLAVIGFVAWKSWIGGQPA